MIPSHSAPRPPCSRWSPSRRASYPRCAQRASIRSLPCAAISTGQAARSYRRRARRSALTDGLQWPRSVPCRHLSCRNLFRRDGESGRLRHRQPVDAVARRAARHGRRRGCRHDPARARDGRSLLAAARAHRSRCPGSIRADQRSWSAGRRPRLHAPRAHRADARARRSLTPDLDVAAHWMVGSVAATWRARDSVWTGVGFLWGDRGQPGRPPLGGTTGL